MPSSLRRTFTDVATRTAVMAGDPVTFLVACGVVILWAVLGPVFHFSDTWQLVINTGTTIVTFLMVFVLQCGMNRDSAAQDAKLDELLRAAKDADSRFIGLKTLTREEIEALPDQIPAKGA